jgi:hypothetical protein
MNKLNRAIDESILNQSIKRVEHNVMRSIELKKTTSKPSVFSFLSFSKYAIAVTFTALIIGIFISQNNTVIPNQNGLTLDQFQSERFAEAIYLSSTIMATSDITVANQLQYMDYDSASMLEEHVGIVTEYFDMLIVFFDETEINNTLTVQEDQSGQFDQVVSFSGNTYDYQLSINFNDDGTFEGILSFESFTYEAFGSIEDTEQEFKIEMLATNETNNNQVSLSYITETKDETETIFQIATIFNNIENTQTIKIERESDETKVQLINDDINISIEQEAEHGENVFELEYKIDNIEGESYVLRTIDVDGVVSYTYQYTEDGYNDEISHERPDYDDDHEDSSSNSDINRTIITY